MDGVDINMKKMYKISKCLMLAYESFIEIELGIKYMKNVEISIKKCLEYGSENRDGGKYKDLDDKLQDIVMANYYGNNVSKEGIRCECNSVKYLVDLIKKENMLKALLKVAPDSSLDGCSMFIQNVKYMHKTVIKERIMEITEEQLSKPVFMIFVDMLYRLDVDVCITYLDILNIFGKMYDNRLNHDYKNKKICKHEYSKCKNIYATFYKILKEVKRRK